MHIQEAFISSINKGNLEEFLLLLEKNPDLNLPSPEDRKKYPPVHVAVFSRQPEILKLLLESGANPNCLDGMGTSLTHLVIANVRGDKMEEMLDILLSHGSDPLTANKRGGSVEKLFSIAVGENIERAKTILRKHGYIWDGKNKKLYLNP